MSWLKAFWIIIASLWKGRSTGVFLGLANIFLRALGLALVFFLGALALFVVVLAFFLGALALFVVTLFLFGPLAVEPASSLL